VSYEDQPNIEHLSADGITDVVDLTNPEACDLADRRDSQAALAHTRPDLKTPYLAPRDNLEESVADLWQKLFSINQIGVDDNFFELGGNSILALQLVSRIRDTFQIELPLHDFLEEPTISRMAQVINESRLKLADADEVKRILDDLEMLTLEEVREKYADELQATKSGS
jgi:acyl carrier protein